MPILPENKKRYPDNRKALRENILLECGDKCEWCGVENHTMRDGKKIILTIAHLDHTPQKHFETLREEGMGGQAAPGFTGGIETQSVISLMDQGGSIMHIKRDKTGTLLASEGSHPVIVFYAGAGGEKILRHLTPKEDERLQGFPDDWTKIPYKGNPPEKCPDRLRYRAIGNSMAVPVMRWIGSRILHVENLFNGGSAE